MDSDDGDGVGQRDVENSLFCKRMIADFRDGLPVDRGGDNDMFGVSEILDDGHTGVVFGELEVGQRTLGGGAFFGGGGAFRDFRFGGCRFGRGTACGGGGLVSDDAAGRQLRRQQCRKQDGCGAFHCFSPFVVVLDCELVVCTSVNIIQYTGMIWICQLQMKPNTV